MTKVTIDLRMLSAQWEPALLMHFADILNTPGKCRMASFAVLANGLLMHIFVAGDTG
jgi:hypothetical protein